MGYRLFPSLANKAMPLAALALAVALAAPAGAADPKAAGTPFEALSGDWKGGGTVTPNKGDPIKVACKATYKVTGNTLLQKLRCAGVDYSINATNKLSNKGGKIKGSWNESVYDASGTVTGTTKDDTIHALIAGDKFSGRMSIKVSDARHTINIVQFNAKSGIYRLATSLTLER